MNMYLLFVKNRTYASRKFIKVTATDPNMFTRSIHILDKDDYQRNDSPAKAVIMPSETKPPSFKQLQPTKKSQRQTASH